MTASALASRYANALVDVVAGKAAGVPPEQVRGELRSFEAALSGSPDLHNVLASPAVAPSRKRAVVGRIADMLAMSRVSRNFLFVLIDHRRINVLGDVLDHFEILLDERLGFTRADIRSAREMADGQRAALVAELERLTGKRVRPRFTVNEDLIGGAVAKIGSTIYDGSVRSQLETLGRRLAAE